MTNVVYWLQGKETQNFGDYLSEILLEDLFHEFGRDGQIVRIVGSAIHDWFVPDAPTSDTQEEAAVGETGESRKRVVFWGCGIRELGGLSSDRRDSAEILAVRGPVSADDLRLGAETPIGDPALLLPALYRPEVRPEFAGKTVCIPHFHDTRSDAELRTISGCDVVLRPNIRIGRSNVFQFIDALCSADFVLCASLHGAIVAVAYGRPFAFWDSGQIDLPVKWDDFAASVGLEARFVSAIGEAREHYIAEIAPKLKVPSLWRSLAASPFLLRSDALLKVLRYELAQVDGNGLLPALDERIFAFSRQASHFDNIIQNANDRFRRTGEQVARLLEDRQSLQAEVDLWKDRFAAQAVELQSSLAQALTRADNLQAQLETEVTERQASYNEIVRERDQLKISFDAAIERAEQLRVRFEAEAAKQQTRYREIAAGRGGRALDRAEKPGTHSEAKSAGQQGRRRKKRKLVRRIRDLSRRIRRPFEERIAARKRRKGVSARSLIESWGQFDPTWYLTHNPDAISAGKDALTHYLAVGAAEDRDPHPLFSRKYYRDQNPDVAKSNDDPFLHYLMIGAREGRSPHPLFDGKAYLAGHARLEAASHDPLGHYLAVGARNGRSASPYFDERFYLEQYPEVREAGVNPLLHYVTSGAAEGRRPNPVFDVEGYSFDNPDIDQFGNNPLIHYVVVGRAKGARPHPLFDGEWYVGNHEDVRASGVDPYSHYLANGRAEGRAPSAAVPPGTDIAEARISLPFAADEAVAVIIPAYKNYMDTFRCLYSVGQRTPSELSVRIILADDCPTRPVVPLLKDVPGLVPIVNPENLGFLRNCNSAAKLARGQYIVFLNNDTIVEPGWLDTMIEVVDRDPQVGLVGSMLLNTDGTIQEAGGVMFKDGWGFPYGRNDHAGKPEYNYVREVDCVIGACLLFRRDLFERLGGFDERYCPAFYEEFDLAFAVAAAGYKVMYQPASRVMHCGSASYGAEVRDRQSLINHDQFVRKWAGRLATRYDGPRDLFLARERAHVNGVILVIDDEIPQYDKHAGALTMFQYLGMLAESDFKVIFAPYQHRNASQPYTNALQQKGVEVLYGDFDLSAWLGANGNHIDYVWVARPDIAHHCIPLIRRTTSARLLYYTHDLHYLREMRRYEVDGDAWALQESHRLRLIETGIFRAVDCVTTPSGEEAEIIRELAPGQEVRVLQPYFYRMQHETSPAGETPLAERQEIIFVGGYRHVPNVDAAILLVRSVMPIVWKRVPQARVRLVGSHPPPEVEDLAGDRVMVTGFVPDVAPYYALARMSVSPLRYGAGVKGKIVSSLEAGIPVVTTEIGNEGIGLVPGVEALVGTTPDEIAELVIRLFEDPDLPNALAEAGHRVIRERFSEERARDGFFEALGLRHSGAAQSGTIEIAAS